MKIQLDIPEKLNKKLKMEKIKRDKPDLKETIIEILEEKLR